MKYFTDSAYERMMMQKPQYSPSPVTDKSPKKKQKIRKLIVVHEKTETKKLHKEG